MRRVLWLDADTLTVEPIDELLAADLAGTAGRRGAGGRDSFVSSLFGVPGVRFDIPPGVGYFNAGVLLIDVAEWAAQRVETRALGLLRDAPTEITLADQGALNVTLAGSWLPLDSRWNARAHVKPALGRGGWLASKGGVRQLRPASILHWAGYLGQAVGSEAPAVA